MRTCPSSVLLIERRWRNSPCLPGGECRHDGVRTKAMAAPEPPMDVLIEFLRRRARRRLNGILCWWCAAVSCCATGLDLERGPQPISTWNVSTVRSLVRSRGLDLSWRTPGLFVCSQPKRCVPATRIRCSGNHRVYAHRSRGRHGSVGLRHTRRTLFYAVGLAWRTGCAGAAPDRHRSGGFVRPGSDRHGRVGTQHVGSPVFRVAVRSIFGLHAGNAARSKAFLDSFED